MSRYFQQIIVPEMGLSGQQKMKAAKVLVLGAGGLGTPVAVSLNAAGVGRIGIVDGDIIEESNLARQFLYQPDEIGRSKVESLVAKLSLQNPETELVVCNEFISENNILKIMSSFDIVCDCTDNAATRILIDAACSQLYKPLVYAAVRDWQGYVTILNHGNKIRLADIFSIADFEQSASNCKVSGIINTTCGIAGNLQANEVIKIILGTAHQLDGEILCFNALDMVFRKFKIQSKKS